MPIDPYQEVLDQLDLKAALTRGSAPNDLLLPRPEDKVGGEVGNRFLEALRRDLERGVYDPVPAYSVRVPKSFWATRPAALLTLNDRVVFDAIVTTLRPRIDQYLLGSEIVFWPRGISADKAWNSFEHSILTAKPAYVVVADISGFYESVDHARLADRLVRATGRKQETEALVHFLNRVMGGPRGIPQGLEASDPLATCYLADLDFGMVRAGFAYARHGDDIRIPCSSFDEAREAVYTLEAQIRDAGLLLNSDKTKIVGAGVYQGELEAVEALIAETRAKLVENKVEALEEDADELAAAIDLAEQEQLGWDFFYHGTISMEEVIEQLRPTLEPNEIELAEGLFEETWARRRGQDNELSAAAFHQQLVASLVRLAAARSDKAIDRSGEILRTYPEKTEVVCSYLSALAGSHPEEVAVQAASPLAEGRFCTEWEIGWCLRVLAKVPGYVPESLLPRVREFIEHPHGAWLAAMEAAKLLGARDGLERTVVKRLWNSSPSVFRADLVVAISNCSDATAWAGSFLEAVRDDRIHEVVLSHLGVDEQDSDE